MTPYNHKTDVNLLARRLNISIALTVAIAFLIIIAYTSYRSYVHICQAGNDLDGFIADEIYVFAFATIVMVVMQYSLRRIIRRITSPVVRNVNQTEATNRSFESELAIAHGIQKSLLPRPLAVGEVTGVNVSGYLRTARQVGGDLYDYVVNGRTLFFAIGDVSGKGVPGALTMATTRRLLRTLQSIQSDITEVMATLNNSLCDANESNQFVTLLIGTLNLDTGRLTICNAGHTPPLIADGNGNVRTIDLTPNIPVGLFPNYRFRADHLRLKRSLILYTDGVTEARNGEGKLYGTERLLTTIKRNIDHPISGLIADIVADSYHFVGDMEQSDDIALLGIELQQTCPLMEKTLTLNNNLGAVEPVKALIDEVKKVVGLEDRETSKLRLALEEAVVNVALYAYPSDESHKFTLQLRATDRDLSFLLVDKGSPFDPTIVPDPDITAEAIDRPIGGLGIMIVKKCMSSVIYEREEGENRLLMIYNYKE